LGCEPFFELFDIRFPKFEVLAEVAAAAVDAVAGRLAGGFFGSENTALTIPVGGLFADFAHGLGGFLVGFTSQARGDLKSVEEDTCVFAVEAMGAELADNLIKRDLNSGSVFDGWEQKGVG